VILVLLDPKGLRAHRDLQDLKGIKAIRALQAHRGRRVLRVIKVTPALQARLDPQDPKVIQDQLTLPKLINDTFSKVAIR
jgi:hypothetical protein